MNYRICVNGKEFYLEVEEAEDLAKRAPTVYPSAPVQTPALSGSKTPVSPHQAPAASKSRGKAIKEERLSSPVTGSVRRINVIIGQRISAGEVVATLSENGREAGVTAVRGGIVKQILVAPNTPVRKGDILVVTV